MFDHVRALEIIERAIHEELDGLVGEPERAPAKAASKPAASKRS